MISHENSKKSSFFKGKITKSYKTFSENKPNFPHFSLENKDYAKKQTQSKPIQTQFKANFGPKIRVTNPIQSQTNPIQTQFVKVEFSAM